MTERLFCIAVTSNPVPYASRTRLTQEFVDRMAKNPRLHLTLVEHVFGTQISLIKCPPGVNHIVVQGGERSELWLKESLISCVGVPSLPPEARKIAWVDADLEFANPLWVEKTLAALDHHAVVQPWSHAVDLGPNYDIIANENGMEVDKSYCAAWVDGDIAALDAEREAEREHNRKWRDRKGCEGYHSFKRSGRVVRHHYGFAWAIRRDVYDRIGGLLDWLVTGSADYHMCLSFVGRCHIDTSLSAGWQRRLRIYADLCERHIDSNVGYVPGMISHHWHGRKAQRFYLSRFQVIRASNFDPDVDLVRNWQGIPELSGNNRVLRDGLRSYLRKRNEDSIDAY
jgi:hypothetical protein